MKAEIKIKSAEWDLCDYGLPRFSILFENGNQLIWHECDKQWHHWTCWRFGKG